MSFLVAVFLAMLGTPPVLWLERKRIPSVVAVLLVVTGMIVVLLIVGGLVGTSLNSFIDALPSYQQRIQEQRRGSRRGWFWRNPHQAILTPCSRENAGASPHPSPLVPVVLATTRMSMFDCSRRR